ncbi:MAG: hypothetical protein KF822_09620 [Steroidobacteraceae bacterium]|nr:hypothetical protein [Steroidobacteraceae bacterium]
MSKHDTGGPAFPTHGSMGEVAWEGMTLRDYFAAKAPEGLISRLAGVNAGPDGYAKRAYQYADAMLSERAK